MAVSIQTDIKGITNAVYAALAEIGGRIAFSLDDARTLAGLAEAKAREIGVPVVFAAVDALGGTVLLNRMDGALPASTDIALNKAFTAAAFRMATHELGQLAQPGQPLYGVQATNQGRVVIFGGGFPFLRGGSPVGAIGVSGGSVEQDMIIAAHALRAFSEETALAFKGETK